MLGVFFLPCTQHPDLIRKEIYPFFSRFLRRTSTDLNMSSSQRNTTFKSPNRFSPLDSTNPPPTKGVTSKSPPPPKTPKTLTSMTTSQPRSTNQPPLRPSDADTHPTAHTEADADMNMDTEDEDALPSRGRTLKSTKNRHRPETRSPPRPTNPSPARLVKRFRSRSRSRPPVPESKDSDSDFSIDSESELEITTRSKLPPAFASRLSSSNPPTQADHDMLADDQPSNSSEDHSDLTAIQSPPSHPPPTHQVTKTVIDLSDSTVTQSDENPPPLSNNPASPTPTKPTNLPPVPTKPLSYADVIRDINSDASSDSDQVPSNMRSRFLRPSADEIPRLLALAEQVNAAPMHLKLDAMAPAIAAIEQARPYTRCPEVTWVFFPRPAKVIQKGKTRNVLGLCEKFHYKFTLGEQDPVFTQWMDHIGRFEYFKLKDQNIVRIHLASHEAREALTGKPMDLGYFGLVTLQSAPIDPWEDLQYLDIPNLPFTEWSNVAAGLAALGAFPFYFGHRQGLNETKFSDATPRYYFGKVFPPSLTIGGKLPRQISYGGRLYLVFIKGYSPPRLDNPRIPCNELITLNPPTRKTTDTPSTHTDPPEAKRTRRNPPQTPTTTGRPSTPAPRPSPHLTDQPPTAPSSSTPRPNTPIHHESTSTDDDMGIPLFNPPGALWTPHPEFATNQPDAPHAQTPARLFTPESGHSLYRSLGFPYRRLDAQFVTLKRSDCWPKDLSPAIRRLRQHQGRLVLSPVALTMQSLDKWIEDQEKSLPGLPEVMIKIEREIGPDVPSTYETIVDHTRLCQPHAVLKILQTKYVAGQCALAAMVRDSEHDRFDLVEDLINQHFFQRVLSSTTPLHCCAFTTKFQDLYKQKPTPKNLRQAMHKFLSDPILLAPLPNRPDTPLTLSVVSHELALAWFELHLMTQAPTFFSSHEAHSLLADGIAVNRLPCWNSEILPSWLLQSIVQSPLGRTVINFMNRIAPEFPFNQILLQETHLPTWPYPTMESLTVTKFEEDFIAVWTPLTEFPPQTPLTSLQRATKDHPSA